MGKKPKAEPDVAEVTTKVVALFKPLTPENRQRVITAALTLLGENPVGAAPPPAAGTAGRNSKPEGAATSFNPKAATWMKQNALTNDQIEQVFDVTSDGVTVIASQLPGKKNTENVLNAYVLQGASRLLASGEPTFTDEDARSLCEGLGCYDRTNHSKSIGKKGNIFAGSKSGGWKLTAPGLKRAADVIKELTKQE